MPGPGGDITTYTLAELIDQASSLGANRGQFAREFEARGLDIDDYVPPNPRED